MILHLDGDAFFASVEVAKNPLLKGRPVVVGSEKGIASAMSYEAKARGVTRAMPIFQVRRVCPEAVVLPCDFDSYALYSFRMMRIVERFTDRVEAYSIDECFAELPDKASDLLPPAGSNLARYALSDAPSYEAYLRLIQQFVYTELAIGVSVGLAPTKVLAKLASKMNKPRGVAVITEDNRRAVLAQTSVGKVWGIGPSSVVFLRGHGIQTALDFADKPAWWVDAFLDKALRESWHELNGRSVLPVSYHTSPTDQQSISHTRSFKPYTRKYSELIAELSHHIEEICAKARSIGLASRSCSVFIKTRYFTYRSFVITVDAPTHIPHIFLEHVPAAVMAMQRSGEEYRAAGATLTGLKMYQGAQSTLFGPAPDDKWKAVYDKVDSVRARFGETSLYVASSKHAVDREMIDDKGYAMPGVARRFGPQSTGLPFMGEVH